MDPVMLAVAGVLALWLLVLTILVLNQGKHTKELFPKEGSRDIRNKLKEVLEAISAFEKNNQILENRLTGYKKESLSFIQKLAILKYNPYNDTGGDQSFSFVLLDGKMDGVLITSLHSRASTRIYLKTVKAGKSELELSKEEAKVLKDAIDK